MHIYFNPIGLTDFSEETKAYLRENVPFATFTFAPDINYNAEVIISYPQVLVKEDLENYQKLKVIHLLSSGYDDLDLHYLKARNIRLFNAKATSATAISELVIGQILNFNYNLTLYHKLQDQKIWKRYYTSIELDGANALVLGAGAIGQAVAKRLKAFNVKSTGYRRRNVKTPHFHEIITDLSVVKKRLNTFQYIIVALPLHASTADLIDLSWFKRMHPSALFINIARGDIVVENDLVEALNTNLIRGAILDVTRKEPLPIDAALWDERNLRLTPHIAFYSDKYLNNVLSLIIKNLHHLQNNEKAETEIKL